MTEKSIFSRIAAVFLCVLTLFSFSAVNASAATYGGSSASTVNVTTKANYWYPGASSVTLKQDKQTLTYKQLMGKPKRVTMVAITLQCTM